MSLVSTSQQNWVGGELSPNMRGRFDLPIYGNGAERFLNFIAETSGAARFRNGFQFVQNTRRNKVGRLIPFQFNDEQAYELEFTEGYIRIYRNNGILTTGITLNITGATATNPVVVTSVAHGLSDGDEVLINSVQGMTELNNRSFVISGVTADTFSLRDFKDSADINGSGYSAYTSGGTADQIFEITTPYLERHLFELDFTQNADTMYLAHRYYEPRKLIRSGAVSWSLNIYTRTSDPFVDKETITAISQNNPGVVTAAAHGFVDGDQIIIETVVGMTQLNGGIFTVAGALANSFQLTDIDGNNADTTAYSAYVSGGYASNQNLLPAAVSFIPGRLAFGYSGLFPESFWASKALDSNGDPQYDDYTLGVADGDAFKFTLAPTDGKVNKIQWMRMSSKFLAIGTFGSVVKADGGSAGAAITPSAIDVRPMVDEGASMVGPLFRGNSLLYFSRTNLTLFSLEYDVLYDAFSAVDKNVVAQHITGDGITQMVFQNGRPPIIWMTRNDGILLGLTYLAKENINGWHRHILGGNSTKILSVGSMPRVNNHDQLWIIAERVVGSETIRSVQYNNDVPVFPELSDFYTGDDNQDEDEVRWRAAMFEAQKEYIHLDSALTYDGSLIGLDAGAVLTPAATTGSGISFFASMSVFTSDMVGRELWKKADSQGNGTGRAVITAYISATEVTCDIDVDFDSTDDMEAGDWYLTTDEVSGLWHLEGETVQVVTDGGEHPDQDVSNGIASLDYQTSVCHVGQFKSGFIKGMSIEAGGVNGPAQTKPQNINRLGIKFLNTLGARYGTNLYNMEEVDFRESADVMDRPAPVFSGAKRLVIEDETAIEKHLFIQQIKPLPCTVLGIVPFIETDNE